MKTSFIVFFLLFTLAYNTPPTNGQCSISCIDEIYNTKNSILSNEVNQAYTNNIVFNTFQTIENQVTLTQQNVQYLNTTIQNINISLINMIQNINISGSGNCSCNSSPYANLTSVNNAIASSFQCCNTNTIAIQSVNNTLNNAINTSSQCCNTNSLAIQNLQTVVNNDTFTIQVLEAEVANLTTTLTNLVAAYDILSMQVCTSTSLCTLTDAVNVGLYTYYEVNNAGSTVINADFYSGPTITGFPPGIVTGVARVGSFPMSNNVDTDLIAFQNCATAIPCSSGSPIGTNNGGIPYTVTPGSYCFPSDIELDSDIILDGGGLFNPVWIFVINGNLITNRITMSVINTINPCNVVWIVSGSATIYGYTIEGSIFAENGILVYLASTITGKLVSFNAGITILDTSFINTRNCLGSRTCPANI